MQNVAECKEPEDASAWSPAGFDEYLVRFPETPALTPEPGPELTARFVERWQEAPGAEEYAAWGDRLGTLKSSASVIFARGYLGNYMFGNLQKPRRALERAGVPALIVKSPARGKVSENADGLARFVAERVSTPRFVMCGHSRGGLESLMMLARHPELAKRCDGVLLSQTSRGPSAVLGSMLLAEHRESLAGAHRRFAEAIQRASLRCIGAARGGLELTGDGLREVLKEIDAAPVTCPVFQTASWSVQPTAWLDSFHERLGEIAPGCAHDGQFFLQDQIWPKLPHVLLPRVDHAQPAMGGFGFDHVRYWFVMLSLLQEDFTQ